MRERVRPTSYGGENPDSYFASFGTFCGADERGVLVLEDAASAA